MATKRFPASMYLRQLRKMEEDLWWWEGSYREAATRTTSEYLLERFTDRANVLADARYQIQKVRDTLYAVPRLS